MSQTVSDAKASNLGSTRRWGSLAVLLGAMTMITFVATIANVATPSITAGLGASPAALSWALSGYQVAYGLSLVTAGRLGDRFGHKWIFVLGLAGYIVAATVSAIAPTELTFVAARLIQGLLGGFVVAPIFAFIQLLFVGSSRVLAFGYLSALIGLSALVGPLLGGEIIDTVGLVEGWRWALALAVPIGIVTLILAFPVLPRTESMVEGKFDVVGMVFLSGVVVGFLAPLVQVTSGTLPDWSWMSFLAALVLAVAFVLWERYLERRGGLPLIPAGYFRDLNFSAGLVVSILTFAAFTSSIYITLSVLWQSGREETAFSAALLTLPFSLGGVVGGLLSEKIAERCGRWTVPLSLAALTSGYIWTYLALTVNPDIGLVALMIPLLLSGFGSGVFVAPNVSSILSGVKDRDAGAGGGMTVTSQRVGAALGSAIIFIVVSRPGPEGPTDFSPSVNFDNGVDGVLFCTVLGGAALVLSVFINLVTRRRRASTVGLSEAEAKVVEVTGSN